MIDLNIPTPQLTSPLTLLSQAGNIQAQQQQSQLRGQAIQSGQIALNTAGQDQQDNQDVRAATAAATDPTTGQTDRGVLLSTLGKLNPVAAARTATNLNAQDTAAKEAAAKLEAAQSAAITAHLDLKDKLLQGVSDQATYTNARNIAIQNGVNPQEMPAQYDPQFVAQAHAQTLGQQQVLANQQATQAEKDRAAQAAATQAEAAARAAETVRHNRADEGLRGQQVAVEQGNLKLKQQEDASDTNGTGGTPAPTVADRNRASLALIARNSLDKIQDVITRRGDMLGPGAGRVSNVDQLIGSNDPDLVALTNEAHNFSMANAGVHGSRSVQNVRDAVTDLLGDLHNGAKGVQGGIDANRSNLNSVIDQGFGSVKMKSPTGQVSTVPYSQMDHYKQLGATVVQ